MGTTGFGKLNNFIFPFPVTLTNKSRLSPSFKFVFDGITLKSNLPTAPEKSAGFPASGSAFTEIVLAPAETLLFPLVTTTRPNISLRFVGNCTSMSNDKGSITSFPDFCGYKTVFRSTTKRYFSPLNIPSSPTNCLMSMF